MAMIDHLLSAIRRGMVFEIRVGEIFVDYHFRLGDENAGVFGPLEHLENKPPGFLSPMIAGEILKLMER